MPSPTKKIPQSATPTKLPLIPGQSTIEGFLSVSKPLNARNDDDVNNAHSKSTATNPPLKRNRRICDDDDDIPMVNITLPATDANNPVVIGDTDNECDANCSVTLQQCQISNQQTADGPKSQSKRQQSSAAADEREGMAKPVYFRY
jgi:hypothetical protein